MEDPRPFKPLPADHPLVGNKECPGCNALFEEGDITTLVTIGPGDDKEAREKAAAGAYYTAVALPAHFACVTGKELKPL